jgi:hypothetical protein
MFDIFHKEAETAHIWGLWINLIYNIQIIAFKDNVKQTPFPSKAHSMEACPMALLYIHVLDISS